MESAWRKMVQGRRCRHTSIGIGCSTYLAPWSSSRPPDPKFSVENRLRQAAKCFARGLPAVVSVHSINLHSSVKDFRTGTLKYLDEFLTALELKYSDLLYLRDEDLYEQVQNESSRPGRELRG